MLAPCSSRSTSPSSSAAWPRSRCSSVGAGLIGTWIVLRGLAFHSHAVGTAAFPGLVLADGLGFAAALGALGAAAVFAVLVAAILARRRSDDRGSEVALVLVGMLALGRDPGERRVRILGRARDPAVRQPAS